MYGASVNTLKQSTVTEGLEQGDMTTKRSALRYSDLKNIQYQVRPGRKSNKTDGESAAAVI